MKTEEGEVLAEGTFIWLRVPRAQVEIRFKWADWLENYSGLDERYIKLLTYLWGLPEGHRRPLSDTSERFNVSRDRVRQIENKALLRFQHQICSGEINRAGGG